MKSAFDDLQRLVGQGDGFVVDALTQLYDGMKALTGHAARPEKHGSDIHEIDAVPVLFKNSPVTFDGVVLAVIGREIEEVKRLGDPISPLDDALEKLRSLVTALRSM